MFCSKFKKGIKELYQKFDKFVQAHADDALRITTGIRAFLTSPLAIMLTSVIPTDLDEQARKIAIAALDKALTPLLLMTSVRTCQQLKKN